MRQISRKPTEFQNTSARLTLARFEPTTLDSPVLCTSVPHGIFHKNEKSLKWQGSRGHAHGSGLGAKEAAK